MTSFFFLKAEALPSGLLLLSSLSLPWITANVIFIWLLSSYRQHRSAFSASHDDGVFAAVDSRYPSAGEHDLIFAPVVAPDDAVVTVMEVEKRRKREVRTAPRRLADRPARMRKKPAGEDSPRAVAAGFAAVAMPEVKKTTVEERPRALAAYVAKPGGKKAAVEERPRAVADDRAKSGGKKAAVEERPRAVAAEEAKPDGRDDFSMDSAWQSIVRSGAARPVDVRKSETWGGEELPRMQRAANKAVARREIRKSATMVPASPPHPSAAGPVAAKQGWRTRDVLVMAHGELLSRAESFIRRQYENLRLQRQESEQRRTMERERRRRPALIRI